MHLLLKFIFGIELHMFRKVPLSIISNGVFHTGLLTTNLYDIYHCCVYSEKLLTMDRRAVRNI